MDLQLDGLRVLITAEASGIGLATARGFAREGARVHVSDVDRKALDALAKATPRCCTAFATFRTAARSLRCSTPRSAA